MKTLKMIIEMLPAIFAGVKTIEAEVQVSGAGAAKAEMLVGLVVDLIGEAVELAPAVQKAITRVVALLKAVGLFGGSK